MQKRSSKKPKGDVNTVAFNVVQEAISETHAATLERLTKESEELGRRIKAKNPAAVALGRLGGLKGGKARAKALTKDQRKAIAIKAAKKRWNTR
jgi:translation initiation factor 2B subunit (eIF-2B alpha/beta/delta family)